MTEINTSPVPTTKEMIADIQQTVDTVIARQDALVSAVNQMGENIAWLVANTQGIFQMFNDPKIMSSMMNGVLGGGLAGLQQPANTDNSEN